MNAHGHPAVPDGVLSETAGAPALPPGLNSKA